MTNVLSVDVEDYFHPTEVGAYVNEDRWDSLDARVVEPTRRILELLARYDTKATFFILGWIARRHPSLIAEIASAGHELGCHSLRHRLVYDLSPDEFRTDTADSLKAIEDAAGLRPLCYRAPSYSITADSLWALDILAELGFTHDSSIYPIAHDRYGIPGFSRHARTVDTASGTILEVPVATVRLSQARVAPVGGGAYLRIFPYRYTAAGIRRINRDDSEPACVYLHPWELDPGQPRMPLGLFGRLRTYSGLEGMGAKLERLLADFQFSTLTAVHPFVPSSSPVS